MFLLLLALFVVTNMWKRKIWLIIAGSPPLYKGDKGDEEWRFLYFPKIRGGYIFLQKTGDVGKILQKWSLLRESVSWLLLIFVFINPRNITIQRIYIRITRFNIYPNFENRFKVKLKNSFLIKKVYLIVFRHKFYQTCSCGSHFQFNNHGLFVEVHWN